MDLKQLQSIMPLAGSRAVAFLNPLSAAMAEFAINTPCRQAAFLAQLAHESGQLRWMEELSSGRQYDTRHDLGNDTPQAVAIAAKYKSTPGQWWKGHGPIQLTGYDLHKRCGEALGIDLLNNPQLLTHPVHGCRAAAWFWSVEKRLNDLADHGSFVQITRRINGGTNGLAERQAFYDVARRVLGC